MDNLITFSLNDTHLNGTPAVVDAILAFVTADAGFGAVKGYVTQGRDYITPQTQDEQFVGKFKLDSYYRKTNEVVASVTLDMLNLDKWVPSKNKNSCDNAQDQLDLCKSLMIQSNLKTLNKDRTDAHRIGHDACHVNVCHGVKVHLVTEKNDEGLMRPVLHGNGLPIVDCIRLAGLGIHRIVTKKGTRKSKDSGSKVLMDNAIRRVLPSLGVCWYKSWSLRDGYFERVRIGGNEIQGIAKPQREFLEAAGVEGIGEA